MKNTSKIFKFTIALILSLTIAFTLPLQVFAITLPEIDTSINTEGYSTEAQPYKVGNIIAEATDKREEYTKQFILDDGSFMAVSYSYPIHFKDDNGNWIDYDNTLQETSSTATEDEATATEYTNKNSDIKVNYSNKSKENNMIKIKADDYQVSWGYPNTNKVTAQVVTNNEQLEGNEKYTTLTNLTSEVLYENVYNNIDIQYITTSVGVKENIILKNSNAQNEFTIQFKINSLTAVAINDKLIELRDKSGKAVYLIEAPYMVDANGEKSTQLSLSIAEQKGNKLTLILKADKTFLSTATYPVIVDPDFTVGEEWNTAECSYVNSFMPNTSYGLDSTTGHADEVYVGSFGQGIYRTYYRFKELPQLNKGDMVVSAYILLALQNDDFYDDFNVSVYQVTESWDQDTLTWNNQPTHATNVTDYKIFDENSAKGSHGWDITDCVKKWYNSTTNNGIMFMTPDDSNAVQCADFTSALDALNPDARPLFYINYRNNKGIEDRWSYSSFSVGTAGTAYINDYSGNLVFVTSDASTASGYGPASVQHIFNNYMAGISYANTKPYAGQGWKTNLQETLLSSSHFGLTGDALTNYPYVYTDSDGTDHYFCKKDSKYLDEDGLGYELTINSSSTTARFTVTDEKDNKMVFNNNGLLQYTQDANGNKVTINYVNDANTIGSVTDASGNTITIEVYDSNKFIKSITDPSGRKREYIYNDTKKLTQIKNPNGTSVYFTYDSQGSLTSVTDVDGYKVNFTYTSSASGKKVSAIQEYGSNGTAGQKITFDRTKYNTTVIKTYGADGITGTNDDLTTTYQFDNWGKTISVQSKTQTTDLGASVYKYTDSEINSTASNIKQLNRVSTAYSTSSHPVNLLENTNMETTGTWSSATWGGANTFTTSYTTSEKYFGQKSLLINSTAYENYSSGRMYCDIPNTVLIPGKTYTLSGYIKTKNVINYDRNSGALLCAEPLNGSTSLTRFNTEYVTGTTTADIDNGWQRVSTTFTVPSNASKTRIHLALRASTGSAYFDGIQLEEYSVANNYNLIQNSSLEKYQSNGLPTHWVDTYSTLNSTIDKKDTKHIDGSYSYRIKGDPQTQKAIHQDIPVSGTENDTYIVGGWVCADAVPKDEEDTRKFKISIMITYSDGTKINKPAAEFNYTLSDWQYTSTAFTLSDGNNSVTRTPTSIRIYLSYSHQANYAYFDNIYLAKDNAQSYTYDEDGNLVTVVDYSDEQSKMEYENSDLVKSIDAKGYAYTYDYDDKHNMTKATSQNGVNYNYTYNSNGLATSLEVKGTNVKSLKSEVTYNEKGQLAKSTDQDKNEVEYTYDEKNGTLTSVKDNSGITNYTYDDNTDQTLTVSKTDEDYGKTYDVAYEYSANDKYLTKINHNDTDYILEYDEFGNKTNSKVGTQSLANYTYSANNGALTSSTYGTGQTVSYVYDHFGNVAQQKYNGTTAFERFADRSGKVIKEKDYINNYQYENSYDTTDRLVRQTVKDISLTDDLNNHLYSFEYGYDLNNNITKLSGNFPLFSFTNNYTYGKDNLLTKYELDSSRNVTYTYDGLNRLTNTTLNTTTPINTSYTYYDSTRGDGYTTTKLETETINGVTYRYVYDNLGNITDIYKGNAHLYYYEYDAMNQLVYSADYENNMAYTYDYDADGNITAEYIYKDGATGPSSSTATNVYTYGDSNWKDKLTAYKGQAITYDQIGNPLTYRDGITMTWQNGRQLATFTQGDTNISYKYDSNSVRTSKTVNGVEHTYAYLNGKLMYETRGEAKFYYSYDANGTLYSVNYTLTDSSTMQTYYYTHNAQGDIIGIYDSTGILVAKYTYGDWGNIVSITDTNGTAITDANHIATLNPFRYRGYYYDSETGFYYLMSRYYDPVTHRFINADGYFQAGGSILDTNMSAYCRNNPVMYSDPTGEACSIHGDHYIDPGCNTCNPGIERARRLKSAKLIASKMVSSFGANSLHKARKLNSYKGWEWYIHPRNTNTNVKKHIHIENCGKIYSQTIDGEPHDGSTGSPPNSVKKYLKNEGIWDWDANKENYENKIRRNMWLENTQGYMPPIAQGYMSPTVQGYDSQIYVMPICYPSSIPMPQFSFYFNTVYFSPGIVIV